MLLSSHLLHEIEVIADDLVVIGNGRIVAAGTKEELLAAAGTLVSATSPRDLAHALEPAGIPSTLARDGCVRTEADPLVGVVARPPASPSPSCGPPTAPGSKMFLSLTADTQREGLRHDRHDCLAGHHAPAADRPARPHDHPAPLKVELARCSTPARDSGC